MADLTTEFCGVRFKNPVVVASLETTNSPDLMKQAFDYGAAGAIIKTLTDIDDMAVLTMNSKYCIMDDRGDIIRGKVPRDFKFYSRSGYSSTYYKDWIPHLEEIGAYARDRDAHLIGSAGARDIDGWKDICRVFEELWPADGRAELRLPASGDDARRPRRQHDRPGRGSRPRGDAPGLRGGPDPGDDQAHPGPDHAGRDREGRQGRRRCRGDRDQPLHRLRRRHRDRKAQARRPGRYRGDLDQAADAALHPQHLPRGPASRSPARTASSTTATSSSS